MSKKEESTSRSNADAGMSTGVAIVGFILCFIAGAGLMWGYDAYRFQHGEIGADSGPAWSDEESPVPVSSKDPMWGKRDALVTIVQFSDFQCPFCSRVEPTMNQVRETYGPEKVRVIWKNEPLSFHDRAKPAAEAAQGVFEMAGNDGFWKFHKLAFDNQKSLTDENFVAWAQQAGVKNIEKFKAGLSSHKWADKVDKDHAVAQQVGVNGTPGFYINGVSLSGAQPFERFKSVIDQELQKAQAKVGSGTARDHVYIELSKENKKNAPPAEEEEGQDDKTIWKVPVGKSPVRGKKTALVTMIVFSDFQCPYCKRVEPTLNELQEKYGDKIRIVWKNEPLPFHPRAEPAAQLALEARAQKGDKGFWDAHDKLFDSQPKLDDADLEKVAQDLGLDMGRVKAAMQQHKYKKQIDEDMDVADDFQASGTPHFFINGRRLVGAQPKEKFVKLIDEEITKAQALIEKGTPAEGVYDALVKDGKAPPPPEKKDVSVPPNAPSKGKLGSKVVMQIFSDFQCPYCKRAEATVSEVEKNYGDKIKIIWRNMPLPMHPDAPLAAEASMEAFKQKGSAGFWQMHGKLFEGQEKENGLKRESLEQYAKEIGLDEAQFKAALDNHTHKAQVDADAKAGNDAGISGTPAFVINGYFINGAQPYPKFRKIIERALAEAK